VRKDTTVRIWLALLGMLPLLLVGSGAGAGNSPVPRNGLIAAGGPGGISLIDAQTSARRLVAKTQDAGQATWSPDGRLLAFELSDENGVNVYSVKVDGTDLHLVLGNAWSPSWSPDGKQLVVARETCYQAPCDADEFATSNLFLVDADGGNPRQLTFVADGADRPAWSPDGKWIAFLGDDGIDLVQPEELVQPEPSKSRWLLGVGDEVYEFAWSPDGAWIAFVGKDGIYRASPPFGEPERLGGDELAEHLSWSPDGARLAFDHSEKGAPGMEIVLLDLASRKETALPRRGVSGFAPTWSPDGQQLAFLADTNTASESGGCGGHAGGDVWTMTVDGKTPRRLAQGDFGLPSWGVDGLTARG
jgi:Tol biopolymer transport system component